MSGVKEINVSTPNEIKVLRMVRESGRATKRTIAGRCGINDEYANYLLEYLAFRGFLYRAGPGRYAITTSGVNEILHVLYRIQDRLRVKMSQAARQNETIEGKIQEMSEFRNNIA